MAAESNNSLSLKIDQNFLNCGICFDPFDDPRGLPCLHAFCFKCLQSWAAACSKDLSFVTCPLCKKTHQIPEEGLSCFPAHFYVTNLKHTVDDERQQLSINQYCTNHEGQRKQYFCVNCDCTTCSDCGLLGDHRGHQFMSLREAARIRRSSLLDLAKEAKQQEQMYGSAIQQMESTERDIEKYVTEEKRAFHKAKDELVKQIEDFAKIHDQNIDLNKEKRTEQVGHIKGKLRVDQATAKGTSDEAVNVMKFGSDDQVISQYSDLSTKLRRAVHFQPAAAGRGLSEVKFESTEETRAAVSSIELSVHLLYKNLISYEGSHNVRTAENTAPNSPIPFVDTDKQSVKLDSSQHSSIHVKLSKTSNNTFTSSNAVAVESRQLSHEAPASTKLTISDTGKTPSPVQKLIDGHPSPLGQELSESEAKSSPAMLIWPILKWKKCGIIRTRFQAKLPHGVAVNSNQDVAVTSSSFAPVAIFSRRGAFLHSIQGSSGTSDIAITPSNQYIMPSNNEFHICDSNTVIKSIKTYDVNGHPSRPNSVAVDPRGRIIVGLSHEGHKTISIHQTDGTLISKFQTSSPPRKLTCASNDKLVVSFHDDSLQLIDQLGQKAQLIPPPTCITTWEPWYVCCSKQGELFVGNWGNPKGVFRYLFTDGEFKYIDCVSVMKWFPHGIALSANADEVYVVDHWGQAVHIYR